MLLILVVACIPAELTFSPIEGDPQGIEIATNGELEVTCSSEAGDSFTGTIGERTGIHFLLADSHYSCTANGPGYTPVQGAFDVAPLPEDLPRPTLVVPNPAAGWQMVSISRVPDHFWALILDERANVRWFHQSAASIMGADIAATWMEEGLLTGGDTQPPTIFDWNNQVIWETHDQVSTDLELADAWTHETTLSKDGTSIFALKVENSTYRGFQVKQYSRTDGSLMWYWSVSEHGGALSVERQGDPFHANSISDLGGAVLVSLRAANMVFKIDQPTRQVVWQLGRGGDFQLLEKDGSVAADNRWFSGQHDAQMIDGLLYLFDNGLKSKRSRALVMELDEQAMTARILREWFWKLPDLAWEAFAYGSVEPLAKGQMLVAYGNHDNPEQPPSTVFEVRTDPDEITWQAAFPDGYRVYRSDWHAAPR